MLFKWMRFITLLLLCATVFFVGEFGLPFIKGSTLPPLGKLLNPYTGFWKNGENATIKPLELNSSALNKQVSVIYDERSVPHIFAKDNQDLYFTQGYVTAQDRLWQMDFISRVAGGKLSEAVGIKAIEFDKFNRRIGLLEAAERAIDTLQNYPEVYQAMVSYSEGVNAYIDKLEKKDYPVEFKLMNYQPERWSPLKSALILKYMAWDLDGGADDRILTNAKQVLPDSLFQAVYPKENPFYEPITNIGLARRRQRSGTFYYNESGQKVYVSTNRTRSSRPRGSFLKPSMFLPQLDTDSDYKKGSNNWVVSGKKTRSGAPILANDPHLSLSLPSLWYENQLHNGTMNVYGVSLPGVPFVVIGFNENAAWGLTYTHSDPIDYTKIELNEDHSQYKLDGKFVNPRIRLDTLKVKNSQPEYLKTIITEVGPIIYHDSIPRISFINEQIPAADVAMNWTAQQPTLEAVTLFKLNRMKNLADYKAAIPYFSSPGQNVAFASKEGDIAIWHKAEIPIRQEEQARFVANEASSKNVWKSSIPFEELPHQINPWKGYLFSANQSPIKGYYKYYLGADDYATFERANRIQSVLDSLQTITPYDFQRLQLDNYSILAKMLLPYLMQKVDFDGLSLAEKDVFNELKSWDYQYNAIAKSPIIFDTWLSTLTKSIFDDEAKKTNIEWARPRKDVVAHLILTDSLASVYDNKRTQEVESQREMIQQSFRKTIQTLTKEYGGLNETWKWGNANPTSIPSLANINGFGISQLKTGGSKRAVNAISGSNGPSWRMIVELGKEIKAYGVYPGGQSGHPGSKQYDEFVKDWARGEYYELHFLKNDQWESDSISKTILQPKK